jgi:division protein CdvB (Snf7/Vps24/ESCRT-III family)
VFRKKPPISERIKEAIHPTPMKRKITSTLHRLSVQLKHLERKSYQLQNRDKELYKKCVSALQSKKNEMATMYANECAEIRKIMMTTIKSQLALEQVKLRLETIKDFGEYTYLMGSVLSVIDGIKSQLVSILPDISNELSDIGETLQNMVVEIGDATDQSFDTSIPTEEGNKILDEATAVAEQKMKETLPEIPPIPTKESKI